MQQDSQSPNADKLLNLGIEQIHNCQFSIATQTLQRALELHQKAQDWAGVVSTLTNLGVAYRNLQQPAPAIVYYQQALELGRHIGAQPFFLASVLNNLGISYNSNGQFQNALECFQQALPYYQQMRERRGEANVLLNLGISQDYLNHPQQADSFYEQTLQIARSLQDPELEANLRQAIISVTQASRGERYQESLASENPIEFYYQRGTTLLEQGRYQEALTAYNSAIQLAPEVAEAHQGKAVVLYRLEQMTEALQACEQALRLRPDFAEAQHIKAGILFAQDKLQEAMTACEAAIRLCSHSFHSLSSQSGHS